MCYMDSAKGLFGLLFTTLFLLVGCTSSDKKGERPYEIFHKIDSSNNALKTAYYQFDNIIKESDSILQLSKKIKYEKGEIQALTNLSRSYVRNHVTDKIIPLYRAYENQVDRISATENKADLLLNLSNMALALNNWNAALDYALHAEKIYRKLNDDLGLSDILALLGHIYSGRIDREKSIAYLQASLDICLEKGFERGTARAYNNLGNAYMMPELDTIRALSYYYKAKEINERLGYTDNLVANYAMIATILYEQKKYQVSEAMFQKAYEIAQKADDRRNTVYISLNIYDLLMATGREQEAIQKVNQARDTARLYDMPVEAICYQILYEHYSQKGNDRLALENHVQYRTVEDSLAIKRNVLEILKTEMKHENEKRKIKSQARKTRITLLLTLLGFILIFVFYTVYQKQKQRNIQQAKEVENKKQENQLLKEKLAFKNKKLANNVINQIRLLESRKQIADYLIAEKKKFATSYYPILNKIIDKFSNRNEDQVWLEFEAQFNQMYKDFFQELGAKFPSLTLRERRLCAFFVMDMTTKEISALTGQRGHAIRQAKTRLREKLGIKGEKDMTIANFLHAHIIDNPDKS